MLKQKIILICFAFLLATLIVGGQIIYQSDFETDQSASFIVQKQSGGDATCDFNYDFLTYVPQPITTGTYPIAQSPNSPPSAGTKAVRFDVNITAGVVDSVTIFPTAAVGLQDYTMRFDLWINYNGAAYGVGGVGTTEFIAVGGHSDSLVSAPPGITGTSSFKGFFWTATGEGGAAQDYRYYEGNGSTVTRTDAQPNWWGAGSISHADAGWMALFTTPPYESTGAPGKAWVTVEMVVSNLGKDVAVYFTPIGGTKTLAGQWTILDASLSSGYPLIAYLDIFSGVANPGQDNFGLIDNLLIEIPAPPTSAKTIWSLYE